MHRENCEATIAGRHTSTLINSQDPSIRGQEAEPWDVSILAVNSLSFPFLPWTRKDAAFSSQFRAGFAVAGFLITRWVNARLNANASLILAWFSASKNGSILTSANQRKLIAPSERTSASDDAKGADRTVKKFVPRWHLHVNRVRCSLSRGSWPSNSLVPTNGDGGEALSLYLARNYIVWHVDNPAKSAFNRKM